MGSHMHPESVLFVTLDSCRYDSFATALAPNMKAVAPLHRAKAPSHFTYSSHAAMFMGFTPSIPGAAEPFIDSKFTKLFRLGDIGFRLADGGGFQLSGRSIIDGFRRLGYRTIGSGAVRWFDPRTAAGGTLSQDFEAFHYAGCPWGLPAQIAFMTEQIGAGRDAPLFAFLNIGETHAPYYFDGAPWSHADNPCIPYQTADRRNDCRIRQQACVEYIDRQIAPLLDRFMNATIVLCSDHGDCWGEDGLWEHGVSHDATLTVPLLVRFRGKPVVRGGC